MEFPSESKSEVLDNALYALSTYSEWEQPRLRRMMNDVRRVSGIPSGVLARFLGRRSNAPALRADDVLLALSKLPMEERRVVVLHYYCDWPDSLVKDELGLTTAEFDDVLDAGIHRMAQAALQQAA